MRRPRGSRCRRGVRGLRGRRVPESSEPAEDKRTIDQPTAVFRTVRPRPGRPADDRAEDHHARVEAGSRSPAEAGGRARERRRAHQPVRAAAPRRGAARARRPQARGHLRPPPASAAAPSLSGAERTRQQPMPPRPPLDLLAELTNTPPPPETPVRTAVRRVKIWTPLGPAAADRLCDRAGGAPAADARAPADGAVDVHLRGQQAVTAVAERGPGLHGVDRPRHGGFVRRAEGRADRQCRQGDDRVRRAQDHPLKKGEAGPSITVDAEGGVGRQAGRRRASRRSTP